MPWFDKYVGIPYKYMGTTPKNGLDCFNLCAYILKKECLYDIPYISSDFCNIADDAWYNKTNQSFFHLAIDEKRPDFLWNRVINIRCFDVILLSIGDTNVANHCALYLGTNKIIHTMQNRASFVSPYGNYYKQYTVGVYRWAASIG